MSSRKNKEVIITTCDLKQDYEVIGPVFYQISNKGLFGSKLSSMKKEYDRIIQQWRSGGRLDNRRETSSAWSSLFIEMGVGQEDFQYAFFISAEEIKKTTERMGGDAVIGMRMDIDIDTNGFSYFYLQMYGTAVKFIEKSEQKKQEQKTETVPKKSEADNNLSESLSSVFSMYSGSYDSDK